VALGAIEGSRRAFLALAPDQKQARVAGPLNGDQLVRYADLDPGSILHARWADALRP